MSVARARRTGRCLVLAALFASLAALQSAAKRPMLFPVDQAPLDPDLLAVRTTFLRALGSSDVERVMAFIADDVHFLGLPGPQKTEIQRSLVGHFGERSLTEHLIRALTLGGSFTTTRGSQRGAREFCAPYVYSAFPAEYEHFIPNDDFPWVIIGNHVPLRSKRDPDASPRRYLNYDIVYVVPVGEDAALNRQGELWPYREIYEPHSLAGFVPADSVRNPRDFHVCLGMRARQWKITEITEGEFPSLRDQYR